MAKFFRQQKKLICQSKTMHVMIPNPLLTLVVAHFRFGALSNPVKGLMCVGNKEYRGIMLENTPNLTSQFSSGCVKSHIACFCPYHIPFWPDAPVE